MRERCRGLLFVRDVSAVHDAKLCVGQLARQALAHREGHDTIPRTPHEQRRHRDPPEARGEIVQVVRHDLPGHISVLNAKGDILLRWISADRCAPGNFVAPHTLCVDSHGDLYVGEVTYTFGVKLGGVPAECHTFQKLARRRP